MAKRSPVLAGETFVDQLFLKKVLNAAVQGTIKENRLR